MKKVYVNEAHFAEDSQTKTDVAITANQRSAKLHQKPVKILEEKQGKCLKRGRTQVSKSPSVSALDLLDWSRGPIA